MDRTGNYVGGNLPSLRVAGVSEQASLRLYWPLGALSTLGNGGELLDCRWLLHCLYVL